MNTTVTMKFSDKQAFLGDMRKGDYFAWKGKFYIATRIVPNNSSGEIVAICLADGLLLDRDHVGEVVRKLNKVTITEE